MVSPRRRTKAIAAFSSFIALVLAAGGTQMAHAGETSPASEEIVDSASALKGIYQTEDGKPIRVEKETGDIAERIITGWTATGEPVQIVVQSSGLSEEDYKRLEEDAASTEQVPLTFTTTPPEVVSEKLETAPLDLDPAQWTPISVIATTSTTASFAWAVDGAFDVKVDGAYRGSSRGGELALTDLQPGEEYSVELREKGVKGTKAAEELERSSSRLMNISTFTGTPSEDADRILSPLTYQPWYNQYVHKAFIPDRRVPGSQCNFFVPGWEFGGDNRSFTMPTYDDPWGPANYRTMMFVDVNWTEGVVSGVKNVGKTQTFHNGVLQNTLYANMDEMKFQEASAGSSYAEVYLRHKAGNPGCNLWDISYSGAITYGEWVQFYRSGTITVDGYRFRAPAHEMYGAFTNTSGNNVWRTISRRQNEGFHCLLGNLFCPSDFYKVSAAY